MNKKQVNQEEFSFMLENYRLSLKEMNVLTELEIDRANTLESNNLHKENTLPNAAAEFINNQLFSCLDNLAALAGTVPEYTVHGCFTNEEINLLQKRALDKLKKLGYNREVEL